MWKHALVTLAVLFVAACGGNKNVKPTGMDGGTMDSPATSESQPSH
jgi:hypothetical protein